MEKYLHNYMGIVVQNNDPEMRGRIKVFIPHVSSPIYENWNKDNDDKIFNSLDNPDIQNILNDLKKVLPWAEYAGPIFGGCASGRYNATLKTATVSDANTIEETEDGFKQTEGYRPVNMYNNELRYPDAFSATGKTGNKLVNPYAYQYVPSNYSNLARGMFSIPNVGSHVWVWFVNGDVNYPVYFASSYGSEDIKRIYTLSQKTGLEDSDATSQDYPASYENIPKAELDSDSKTFRSKHVINSNKHSLEMIDTDGRESLKLNHYSGSLLEFNNDATIRMSTGNDQLMVNGDSFNTFWKNQSSFVGGIKDSIVQSDVFEKVGKQNAQIVKQIYDINKETHDKYKLLFDIKRTGSAATSIGKDKEIYKTNVVSNLQAQEGSFAICPVCNGIPYAQQLWEMSPDHLRMCLMIPIPDEAGGFPCIDIWVPGLPPQLDINGSVGYKSGYDCPLCNLNENIYTYSTLNGPRKEDRLGLSPSTFGGLWKLDTLKTKDLPNVIQASNNQILQLQSMLGEGGDKIVSIARNHVVNVGLIINDLKSYRVDSRGKLKTTSLFVSPEEVILTALPTPHVEHVDVEPTVGGDYILTAGNKLKILVGANGINIKTFGPIEMYGTIVNLTAEELNILSKHSLFIDGGEKLSLRARNISLNPFEHNPVLIEGGLHVSRNAIVKGGAYIDGELGVQHITAPREWRQTEDGGGVTLLVETLPSAGPGVHQHFIILQIPDHKHYYESIPLTLTKCKEETRDIMAKLGINSSISVKANPIQKIDLNASLSSAVSTLSQYTDTSTFQQTLTGLTDLTKVSGQYSNFNASVNSISEDVNKSYVDNTNKIKDKIKDIQDSYETSLNLNIENYNLPKNTQI